MEVGSGGGGDIGLAALLDMVGGGEAEVGVGGKVVWGAEEPEEEISAERVGREEVEGEEIGGEVGGVRIGGGDDGGGDIGGGVEIERCRFAATGGGALGGGVMMRDGKVGGTEEVTSTGTPSISWGSGDISAWEGEGEGGGDEIPMHCQYIYMICMDTNTHRLK